MVKKLFFCFITFTILAVNLYAAEPTELPVWDENDTNTITISQEQKDDGFAQKARPASGTFNSWMRNVYKWVEWYKEKFTDVDSDIAKLQAVDNIADLRAITYTPIDGAEISVLGYNTPGDGGGGLFYWDYTSTETDVGGNVIKVTSIATGRWKRLVESENVFNVKHWGAYGDGTNDDTVRIQAAFDAADYGDTVFFPGTSDGEYYRITDSISLPTHNINILGQAGGIRNSRIRQETAGKDVFASVNTTADNNMTIKNMFISGISTARYGIDASYKSRCWITDCAIEGFGYQQSSGAGIRVNNSLVVNIQNCKIGSVYNAIEVPTPVTTGWNGGGISNCYINATTGAAIDAYSLAGVSIKGTTFESCFGGGIKIELANGGIDISGCYFEENLTSGGVDEYFDISLGTDSNYEGVSIRGNYFNGYVAGYTEDYYPIRIKFGNAIVTDANFVNTGSRFIKFTTGGIVTNSHFGKLAMGGSFNYDDTSADGTYTNFPGSFFQSTSNNYADEITNRHGSLNEKFITYRDITTDDSRYTKAVTGTGSSTSEGLGFYVDTGTTAASTSLAHIITSGLDEAGQSSVDYGKDITIKFSISNIASGTTNGESWVMLTPNAVASDPTDVAVGIKVVNNALYGLVATASTTYTTDLSTTLSAGILYNIKILKALSDCKWYVNGDLVGTDGTSGHLPTGSKASRLVVAVANNADSARQRIGLYKSNIRVALK